MGVSPSRHSRLLFTRYLGGHDGRIDGSTPSVTI